tara:strand:+ start:174 stop:626 length:453 start_codon:yes stop_codon:yes gene_type:complete
LKAGNSRIRRAQVADAAGLASCIDAAYARYTGHLTDLPPVSEGCAAEIENNQVWVAVDDGEIVAGLVLVAQAAAMKLANVAVHPDHGGRGLGRELLALSETEARKQGYSEMRLNTHVGMPENVRFYIRLGWKEISREGNTVSMSKRLEPE